MSDNEVRTWRENGPQSKAKGMEDIAVDITIDAMRQDDIPAVRALWETVPELGPSRAFDTAVRLSAYLLCNPGFSTVARLGNQIVGAAMCGHDGRRGSFYHTAVLPVYRRRGIAKRMIERSLSCLRDAGLSTAFVFTHAENESAAAFWTGTGWEYCPWVRYNYREF